MSFFKVGDAVALEFGPTGIVEDVWPHPDEDWYAVKFKGELGRSFMQESQLWAATLQHEEEGIYASMVREAQNPVQSPSHYDLPGGIQVIDLIRGDSFLRGNALKYIFRAPHKGKELEDMKKSREYINWEIERLENEQSS